MINIFILILTVLSLNCVPLQDSKETHDITRFLGLSKELQLIIAKKWLKDNKYYCIEPNVNSLVVHSDMVTSSLKVNDNIIVSIPDTGIIKFCSITTGQCLNTFKSIANRLFRSLLEVDNNITASRFSDGTIKLWSITTGQCINTLEGHSGWPTSLLKVDDNTIASGSHDQTIKLWSITTGQCINTLKGHGDFVTYLLKVDDDTIASFSVDKTIKLWSWDNLKNIEKTLDNSSPLGTLLTFIHGKKMLLEDKEKIQKSIQLKDKTEEESLKNWIKSIPEKNSQNLVKEIFAVQ